MLGGPDLRGVQPQLHPSAARLSGAQGPSPGHPEPNNLAAGLSILNRGGGGGQSEGNNFPTPSLLSGGGLRGKLLLPTHTTQEAPPIAAAGWQPGLG